MKYERQLTISKRFKENLEIFFKDVFDFQIIALT